MNTPHPYPELDTRRGDPLDADDPDELPVWLHLAGPTVLTLVLLAALAMGLAWIGRHVGGWIGWLAGTGAVQTVTVPVHNFLAAHADGVPISAGSLFTAWAVISLTLWVLAIVDVRAARAGWVAAGAATGAMVHAATPEPSQLVAVGVVTAWWILLSAPALSGTSRTTHVACPANETPGPDQADVHSSI